MAKTLTTKSIEAAKPAATRCELPDGGCRGLYLITQPSGIKSWACRFRLNGKTSKLTLGQFPAVSLAEARKLAATAMEQVARGIDPAAEKREAKATDRRRDTVARLAALFIEQHAKRKTRETSWKAVEGTFRREVLPAWGDRPIESIRRRDVADLVNAIAMTRPILANRTLAHLSRFFRWCVARDWLAGSPCIGIERPAAETVRSRCLTDDEVRKFWAATDTLSKRFGDIFRLLLLSAARRQEVAGLRWAELDFSRRLWTLPAARNKAGVDLVRPLGPKGWAIIEAQPRAMELVFGSDRSGFAFGHFKSRLDEVMQPATPWTTHDLRRTARTLLSRARVDADVAEMLLGHTLPGLRRTYDTHGYLDEKRAAYVALEREIDLILNPPEADVITFRR
jgi:integrase